MGLRPFDKTSHQLAQCRSQFREGVLDARWNFRVDSALDKAIAFHAAECHRQHPLTDASHTTPQLVESQRAGVAEYVNDIHRPFVADSGQHLAGMAVRGCVLQLARPSNWLLSHWLLQSDWGTFKCLLFRPKSAVYVGNSY